MRKLIYIFFLLSYQLSIAQSPLKARDTTIKGSQTFAMIVGISKYKYVRPLTYADKDAELFRDYLKSPGGGKVKDENIFCLLNDQALNINFWGKGFQWLKAKKLQRGDKLFIYLAGHGDAIDEDQFFFLAYDCNPGSDKNNYLISGAIQLFNLKKKIADETAKGVDVIFIMDACRSNELPGGTEGQNFLNTAITEKKAGDIIMLATGAGQASLEDASIGNGHGLFTYYLVDGLNGMADSLDRPDQRISFREIQSYVNRTVPSIAQQRFRQKQEPFFCCTENSERIISTVDTAYLRNWLRQKRLENRGPGNAFYGVTGYRQYIPADTTLVDTYNKFNNEIKSGNLYGRASAEDYYRQLNIKYPGNPYTLDAQSTYAVAQANVAQKWVNDYIDCFAPTKRQQEEMRRAGEGLERAIETFKEYDADFANSLRGRMYFLKSNGDEPLASKLLNAYAALAIDPGGAYIHNQLALIHREAKNYDSARFYARKAAQLAPKWLCALNTLGQLERSDNTNNGSPDSSSKKKVPGKSKFGFTIGGGLGRPKVDFNREGWRQGNADYNDSLVNITSNGDPRIELGFIYYQPIGSSIAIRPAFTMDFEGGEVVYERKSPTGAPSFPDPVSTERMRVNVSFPFIINLSKGRTIPYLSLGATAGFLFEPKNDEDVKRLPLKKFDYSGDAGLGIDLKIAKGKVILSPELKYAHGFGNLKGSGNNLYLNTISSVKRQSFLFNLYLRNAR